MATSSPRDVILGIGIQTSGEEQIKKLQAAVLALAKQGGAAAPEFQELADQIARLADQQGALSTFQQLAAELDRLTEQQVASAAASDLQATKLADAARAADQAKNKQAAALQTQREATQALAATSSALTILRNSYDENGERVADYKAQLQQLVITKEEERAALASANLELKEANNTAKAAVSEQNILEGAYRRANQQAQASAAAYRDGEAALRDAAASAEALGLSTANVATTQVELGRAVSLAGNGVQALTQRTEQLAAAQRQLNATAGFEKLAREAEELVSSASGLSVFDQALEEIARSQRELQAVDTAAKFQRDAFAMVEAIESAQRLQRETELLVAVQRELAGQRAFEKQAADAANLIKAAEYVRFWETELSRAEQQAQQTAIAAETAAAKIANAFRSVGTRSAQELEDEIQQVRAAMVTLSGVAGTTGQALSGAFTAGEAKIAALERQLRELNGTMTTGDRLSKVFSNSLGQIAAGNLVADAVGYLVNKVKELGREFIAANVQMETMRRGLAAIYGDSRVAAAQIDFLRSSTQAAGISMSGIADSFVRFSAATKSANIPLSVTNDLFNAVTRAGATLGLSVERVTLVLDALGQMASKGVVSMEELRQQLGDSLPGALSLAAKGLGITDQQLIKLVESGQLAARDFFPALTQGLKDLQGSAETLTTKYENLKNALFATATTAGDAGWTDVLKAGLEGLRVVAGLIVLPLTALSEIIFGLARAAGILTGALITLSNPLDQLKQVVDDAAERQTKLMAAFEGGTTAVNAQSAATQTNTTVQYSATSAILAGAAAQAQTATATAGATAATVGASNAYVQMLVGLQANVKAIESNIVASEKLLDAKQLEGKATLQTAQITGNAATILEAANKAARDNVAAIGSVVQARQAEVASTQLTIDRIRALAEANGGLRDDQAKLILSLEQKLAAQNASLEKSVQERAEMLAQATATGLAAAAYRDNAAAVDTYRNALALAQAGLPLLTAALTAANAEVVTQNRLFAEGRGSLEAVRAAQDALVIASEALNAARRDAAAAEALYRDALQDSVKALELSAKAASVDLQATLARINVGKLHDEVMARNSALQGDNATATYYTIAAKEKEIAAIRVKTQISELESKAEISALEIKKQEIALNDPLREQKLKELEIRIQLQRIKLLEAGASQEIIKGIQGEIQALREGNGVRGGSTASINENTAARLRNAAAIQQQGEAERRTSDGFKANADGSAAGTFNNTLPVDAAYRVRNKNRAGTLTAADLADAEAGYKQAFNAQDWLSSLPPGAVSGEAMDTSAALLNEAKFALEKVKALAAAEKAAANPVVPPEVTAARSGPLTPNADIGAPAAAAGSSGGEVTVNVNMGSNRASIKVASQADANSLVGLLRSLESSSGVAV